MSGSGGRGFSRYSPQEIRGWIEEANHDVDEARHNSEVNASLGDLLAQYNDRDVVLTRTRLDEIQVALEDALESTVDLRFGGSIAKHTFVDGLSDVDALAILRDKELAKFSAKEVLDKFASILRRDLGYTVRIAKGRLAVTIVFPDGMEIQILPAVQTPTGVRIPSSRNSEWSNVIRPQAFAEKLTQRNKACGGRLIPVVKLAKSVLAELPDTVRPSGYHVESLAVEAFKSYKGPNHYKGMLHHFFQRSSQLVLSPIRDSTGQSLSVDQDLGKHNSQQRRTLSGALDRIARRMANADRARSSDDWLMAIGESL